MRYSILFVIALILVSGFVAYFGDILGRKMGKRRLTLFNLRPRYTAIVVTTITGMLISAFALAALVSVNSQFKRVFTEGDIIFAKNDQLSRENVSLGKRNADLQKLRRSLEKQVAEQRKEVNTAREEVSKAASARDAAVAAVKRLEREIAARQNELESLRAKSDAAVRDLEIKTRELSGVQADLQVVQGALTSAQESLAAASDRLLAANARLSETNTKLAEAEQTLQQQEIALAGQRQQLEEQQQRLVEIGKESLRFQLLTSEFRRQASQLRSGSLVLRQGDEVARASISPRQSPFIIKSELIALLESASERARALGAGAGPNSRNVTLIFRQILNAEYGVYNDDENDCISMAVDAISQNREDALVQVVCASNTIAGEQAEVEFVLYHNKIVYHKGDWIATTEMNGRLSEGRVLLAVIKFLQEDVTNAAMRAGIVPVSNPDPRANVGPSPQRQMEGLINVVDQIKAKGTRVTVEVYACADIYAADALNMTNMRFGVAKTE